MAQVEMVCGPYRLVSLMSAEAADGARPRARRARHRVRQVHQRRRGAAVRTAPAALVLALAARPGCWPAAGRAPTAARRSSRAAPHRDGHDHRAGRLLADRTFTELGQAVRGRPPRREGASSPSTPAPPWPSRSPRALRPTCWPPPTSTTMQTVVDAGGTRRRARGLRHQPPADGGAAGQPGRHHAVLRPRQARREVRRVRGHRALRQARAPRCSREPASPRSRPARRST